MLLLWVQVLAGMRRSYIIQRWAYLQITLLGGYVPLPKDREESILLFGVNLVDVVVKLESTSELLRVFV